MSGSFEFKKYTLYNFDTPILNPFAYTYFQKPGILNL